MNGYIDKNDLFQDPVLCALKDKELINNDFADKE